jgi:hypothetical protein
MYGTTKALLSAIAMIAALSGCSNGPIAEIDEEVDCANICDRYRDCYNASYDTAACRNRCQGVVDGGDSARADMCDACLDSSTCIGAAFGCATECQGILP